MEKIFAILFVLILSLFVFENDELKLEVDTKNTYALAELSILYKD